MDTNHDIGPVGVMLHGEPEEWEAVVAAAPTLETLGFSTLWIAGGQLNELGKVREVLRATREVPVGASIIPVDHFPAPDVATVYAQAQADHPGRFVAGLGGAHGPRPLRTLATYMDYLDQVPPVVPAPARMLAAMGPRMLELARDRTAGALPMLMIPESTARARSLLGADSTLVVHEFVVVETDPERAREPTRRMIGLLSQAPGYATHLRRMGFTDDDVQNVSDRMVDALVAWGDVDAIAAKVREHLDAGADQVSLIVLTPEGSAVVPTARWEQLAEALLPGQADVPPRR